MQKIHFNCLIKVELFLLKLDESDTFLQMYLFTAERRIIILYYIMLYYITLHLRQSFCKVKHFNKLPTHFMLFP